MVVGITSNAFKGLYTIGLNNDDLDEGQLFLTCCIKVENILKIDKDLIIKKIGKLKKIKQKEIFKKINEIINVE